MKKILVTGGAGFIGSNLCERLSKDSHNDVYSLDNYFTGKKENHVNGVTYIHGHTKNIDNLIKFKPDLIFHLGEYSRVEQSFDDIDKVWDFNKYGTFAVLEFTRKTKAKIIYAGSSTKFGNNGSNSSPYAWSKSTNTQLVKNYADWYNIDYAITYFYNVYGQREIQTGKYATLIALFKEKMKNGENLTVVSPGTQIRNFTHIDDTIDALLLIAKHGYGDEYGIGNPAGFTVLDIASFFGGTIEMLPERKGNRMTADVVTDKTKAIGWKPKRSLIEYIEKLKLEQWI